MTITLEETLAIAGGAVTVLTLLLTGTDFLIRRWLQKHRDDLVLSLNAQLATLHSQVAERTKERDEIRDQLRELKPKHDDRSAELSTANQRIAALSDENKSKDALLGELREVQDALNKKQKTHDNRIRRALQMEGAIWTQAVMAGTPAFVPLRTRHTPIVSVLNLKGGVGKTTITAYLAWALSARGFRVLLLDLDLQGSLSSLFLRNDELSQLGKSDKLFQHFLTHGMQKGAPKLLSYAVPIPQLNQRCRLVAASDRLAYAELSQTVRWLLRVGSTQSWNGHHDGRMILRRALHQKGLYKKFDVILLDCPPLINLCCANALAASDYVLIPATPSLKSIERVTPLLRRIQEMQREQVNPDLKPFGIVVNRTDRESLTPREQLLFHDLPRQCLTVYGSDVDQFDTVIQQRIAVRDGEECFTPPEESHPLRKAFELLAEEFIKRLPDVCCNPDMRKTKKKAPETTEGMG